MLAWTINAGFLILFSCCRLRLNKQEINEYFFLNLLNELKEKVLLATR